MNGSQFANFSPTKFFHVQYQEVVIASGSVVIIQCYPLMHGFMGIQLKHIHSPRLFDVME